MAPVCALKTLLNCNLTNLMKTALFKICFWLHWVFIAAPVSRGYSLVVAASRVVEHEL